MRVLFRQVRRVGEDEAETIAFPEPVYTASLSGNPEYDATTFRYSYTSLNRPSTLYEYNIANKETEKLKEQEVPSGFNPDDYTVERLWTTAPDGVQVPMAVVYKNGTKKDGSNPALLYSYGSYGISSDVYFSASMYSLIDRGFVYAIAQIRGGSDLGEQWYEDGKLLHKKNTFTDFIACSEKLIEDGYTSSGKLAAMGGSAGVDFIGEIGLDNYWNYGTKERQKELFVAQIKYATRCKKPIIIHSRDADTEMIQTLNEVDLPHGGIMHCYSSGWELLETAIEKGLYISFAGPITFKNAKELHKMVSYVPLHLLLLETDSPYLAPHPHRGKINTPLNMRYIYDQAALLREMEVEDLIKVIQQNFESLCKGH